MLTDYTFLIYTVPSLKYQRVRGDLIYIYKLVHNLLDMYPASLFTFQSSSITRGHCFKIFKPHATHPYRDATFFIASN